MLVLGIDPSAKKIAVVGVETFTNTTLVNAEGLYAKGVTKQTPESLATALTFLEGFILSTESLAPAGQRFAYVESPLVGRGGAATTIKQAYIGGIIRACLAKHEFEVYDANPSTWRKALGIKAAGTVAIKAATKAHVAAHLPKAVPRLGSDSDLFDAAAICLYGLRTQRLAGRIAESAERAVQDHRGPGPVLRGSHVRPRVRRRGVQGEV